MQNFSFLSWLKLLVRVAQKTSRNFVEISQDRKCIIAYNFVKINILCLFLPHCIYYMGVISAVLGLTLFTFTKEGHTLHTTL